MIGEYQEIYQDVASTLKPFGFMVERDEDFYSEFIGQHPIGFAIEGDRVAYPGFSLLVFRTNMKENQKSVSVALLMQMTDAMAGRELRKPSLANQLDFIAGNFEWIEKWEFEEAYREYVRKR